MPKHDIDDDPMFDLSEQAKALAKERGLDRALKEIASAEAEREAASKKIKMLWRAIEKQGHDVREARQRYVRMSLGD